MSDKLLPLSHPLVPEVEVGHCEDWFCAVLVWVSLSDEPANQPALACPHDHETKAEAEQCGAKALLRLRAGKLPEWDE